MAETRTVLVTGGASGIGLAVVQAALAEGWRAVVADRDERSLAAARATLGGSDAATFATLDVSDEAAVVRLVAGLDGLAGVVNSAGIARDLPALDTDAELFRKILDVNVVGSFVVAREAAKRMLPGRHGSIVNIASVSGIQGNEGRVAYGASKGAVITMTKVMALELAPFGIRVNAVAPGPIETAMVREVHTPESRAAWLSAVPQRRYGTPEEIAASVLFLLDGQKSGYVTGQTLAVDGGFTIAGLMSGTAVKATGERG